MALARPSPAFTHTVRSVNKWMPWMAAVHRRYTRGCATVRSSCLRPTRCRFVWREGIEVTYGLESSLDVNPKLRVPRFSWWPQGDLEARQRSLRELEVGDARPAHQNALTSHCPP